MNLFVLVSTGQKVANLPPVLELAKPGDQTLWIVSEEARRRNWTYEPRAVLEETGLVTRAEIDLPQVNDPFLLTTQLRPIANSLDGLFKSVYLVTNGGTKHTPIGLLNAFQHLSPMLLYGDERPAVYSIYPSGFTASPRVSPYTRHKLDLALILRVNGYTFATGSEHCLIWPNALQASIASEKYGRDEQYTYQLHWQHFAWASAPKSDQRVLFDQLSSFIPDSYQKWKRTLQQLCYAMNAQNLSNVYNATLNLGESAKRAAARQNSGVTQPEARIGDSLERAVARRVVDWQATQKHPAIQSIWMGVKIARINSPHIVDAEYDILIVLKNGVLIHLECKSANVEQRELDVNTHRLRQAASQLARSAVVVPIFTRCVNESWFDRLHVTRLILEEQVGRQNVLAFTWPGQPDEYQMPEHEGTEPIRCISFEECLDSLLRAYRP